MDFPQNLNISLGSIDTDESGDNIYLELLNRLKNSPHDFSVSIHEDREKDLAFLKVSVESEAAGECLASILHEEFENFFDGTYVSVLKHSMKGEE